VTRQRAQASVETVTGAVVLVCVGLIGLQILGAGYAAVMAGHAAEAAALAAANGRNARKAAADAVPGWPERALDVHSAGGSVRVTMHPPSLFGLLGHKLAIRADAAVRTPRGRPL
jgi:pyrimidine deaminase RibD-like protein